MDWAPESRRYLLRDDPPAFAILATRMRDGSPQATPVWFDLHDGLIRVNTEVGLVKYHNMLERPEVALTIIDPQNWYRYMQVRGVVVDYTEEGAREHIDQLAGKYTGRAEYSGVIRTSRIIFRIRPTSVYPKE